MPEPMQNPQTVDNSAVTDGTDTGNIPTGEGLSLAQAMGYDLDGTKPTTDDGPAKDTPKPEEGSEPKKDEPKVPTWTEQLNDELKGDGKTIKTLSKFNSVSDLAKATPNCRNLWAAELNCLKKTQTRKPLTLFGRS